MPTNQVKPLDVNAMAQGMVTAMTFSVFGSAMGALMSGADYTNSPARTKFNDKGLAALTEQFGTAAVNAAKEKIGKKTDIVTLAKATEEVVLADLNTRYLPTEVATALAACPAGDYNCVKKVASTLHGNVPSSPEAMKANAATSASRFVKMRRAAVSVLDKKTN